MPNSTESWQYLILTAANDDQAAAYESQIRMRRAAGELAQVRDVLVVADPQGRRVGSGGSTLECLLEVLRRESGVGRNVTDFSDAEKVLRELRILIVHAGGDSRRLPAYSPCGKIFVPLPADSESLVTPTLFDRLVPAFLGLPTGSRGAGQIVVASGDALILFDRSEVGSMPAGLTALSSKVSPEEAARHGVLCPNRDGSVRLYLQKPDIGRQAEAGAIGPDGLSLLDIGVMSLDAGAAVRLLRSFCEVRAGAIRWTPSAWNIILTHGIDLYREICCALGTDATFDEYMRTVRSSGSKLEEPVLAGLFAELRTIPFHLQILRQCSFLHFGSSRQLISSGEELIALDRGSAPSKNILAIGTEIEGNGRIDGIDCWVEGCRLRAPLRLAGRNVVVGVDVLEPFELSGGTCLDLSPGFDREGRKIWFVRYYGIEDTFKHPKFCGKSLAEWLRAVGAADSEIWDAETAQTERTLWNARVFPAESEHEGFRLWSWMLDVDNATTEQKNRFLAADRYSSAEIAVRVDQDAWHARRAAIRALYSTSLARPSLEPAKP